MTNLPASNSDKPKSSNFELLHSKIQKWIWDVGWSELKDAQELAIPLIIDGEQDVLISASTASGKTEAAFLPILTTMLKADGKVAVLYISPLKALINDQWGRLYCLCEQLGIPAIPWHGDVSDNRKKRFLKQPQGILLISPESLEAMLMNRGHGLAGIFKDLRYIVVDELHSFIGTERGRQLQSLMNRLETALNRTVPRIGLSATIGDMHLASHYLRSGNNVSLIQTKDKDSELRVLVKGYVRKPPILSKPEIQGLEESDHEISLSETVDPALKNIGEHLYKTLRGVNNLIFPNSRGQVEIFADLLRDRCEKDGVPNEFWPHHGNLSKEIREETEAALKSKERPATAVCTTTLELGIDIGAVKSVAQIGPAPSVASLRQRLGRSGRRKGEPAILRSYVIESEITPQSPLSDQLREKLVMSIAQIRLLVEHWYEPPRPEGLHFSTLVQQLLSSIAQYGGLTAKDAWKLLCISGPFKNISQQEFADFLRSLAKKDVLIQEPQGLILHGPTGEKMIEHYSFYAAFNSDDEFRLVSGSRRLGSMPISRPIAPGSYLIFAGRRWRVLKVDMEKKLIDVAPDHAGRAPLFDDKNGLMVHQRVRHEMRRVLAGTDEISFIDKQAQILLQEARDTFQRLELKNNPFINQGTTTFLFLWSSDWIQDTLILMFGTRKIAAMNSGLFIEFQGIQSDSFREICNDLLANPPTLNAMLANIENLAREKWDNLLENPLIMRNYASHNLDIDGALKVLKLLSNYSALA